MTHLPAVIPSPTQAVWWLGPVAVRAYALCILAGVGVALWLTVRRWKARGGEADDVLDVATWALPLGLVGGRIYHVVTSPEAYFGEGGDPWKAFAIWEGGLGIWGAVALGAVGAWWACRSQGWSFAAFADAVVPGLLLAQALGRFGNWFNNELYGGPTDLPWGLRIHQWDHAAGRAVTDAAGDPVVLGTFHPTFLYEAVWCVLMAALVLWLDRVRTFAAGQLAGLYLMLYTLGRFFIEMMRTDEANTFFGQRINVWVSLAVFLLGLFLYWRAGRKGAPSHRDAEESGARTD
ncbi:prolipoprotein diacylglyceryl transferase [Kytococcus aerolatus]|uniref:Phosphatidylglycerol--prolipoprotein diacylglyceryl transferase n=1 Tax=Kytococcus aerolatus TaxID=592308 RepID=A0A212T062_9MICO|nr:prolipoprotein diacylglyceryl transferase [Kytococcus aerolatus]SNC59395.1 prolipoprotein diacylglyceryl transferase [Kytococcus aerolatus]